LYKILTDIQFFGLFFPWKSDQGNIGKTPGENARYSPNKKLCELSQENQTLKNGLPV